MSLPSRTLPGEVSKLIEPSTTPGRLRRFLALVILMTLLAGMQLLLGANGLRTAPSNEPQETILYARLSKVQANLLIATATAQLSALSPEASRTTHSQEVMDQVSQSWDELLEAARTRPESADDLKTIGQDILQYSFSLGSITGASQAEAASVLPKAEQQLDTINTEVDALKASLKSEITADLPSVMPFLGYLFGVLAVGAVVWASIGVAHKTHRVLNLGLLGAAVGMLVMLGTFAGTQQTATDLSADIRDDYLAKVIAADTAAQALGQAHLMLTSAALTESWSNADSTSYAKLFDQVKLSRTELSLPSVKPFATSSDLLRQIENGSWSEAQATLLDTGSSGVSAAAEAYFASIDQVSDQATETTTTAAATANQIAIRQMALIALLALGGAAAAVGGIRPRLREFR